LLKRGRIVFNSGLKVLSRSG